MDIDLVDGLEHGDYVSIQLGISSSHLTVILKHLETILDLALLG